MNRVKYILIKLEEIFFGLYGLISSGVSLNYCIENNAGDSFNKFFIENYLDTKVSKYTFGKKRHYLFCGSILGRANKFSTVVGAGFISKEQADSGVEVGTILGVRGVFSLESLKNKYPNTKPAFIGDPGLLAREVMDININVGSRTKIGVIPHFVDFSYVKDLLGDDDQFMLIDIRRPFNDVCHDILLCRSVLSSSLHGLIFSDAMNIPNAWIRFSDKVKGGDFKFLDYYSVMTNPKTRCFDCQSISNLVDTGRYVSVSENPSYDKMRRTVYEAFS